MPTYEYECKSCGHRFEAMQSMSDDPLSDCPECGKQVRRIISAGLGIIFKGSGFYVTDNRGSNGSGSNAETAKSGESKGDSASSTDSKSSDSKSDGGSSKPKSESSKDSGSSKAKTAAKT